MYLTAELSLGDPHHNPIMEDRKGTIERVAEVIKKVKELVPEEWKFVWHGEWDEDFNILVGIPPERAVEVTEAFKALEGAYHDKGCDEWLWEGPVVGHYHVFLRLNMQEGVPTANAFILLDHDVKSVIEAAYSGLEEFQIVIRDDEVEEVTQPTKAKLIKITTEEHPEESRAGGWWAYFKGKPTKQECLDVWNKQYGPNSGAIHDIEDMPDEGPMSNDADPELHKPGIWRVWLGCYQ